MKGEPKLMKEIFNLVYKKDDIPDDLYIQGFGFIPTKTREVTKSKIKKVTNIFSILLMSYFLLKVILMQPVTYLSNVLGFEVYTNNSSGLVTTSVFIESLIRSSTDFIAFLTILLIGYFIDKKYYDKFHFFKKTDLQITYTSVMISLSFWTIGNFVAVIIEDLFKIFGIINAPAFQSISLLESLVQDNVLMLIIMSILHEIFFRGIVLFKLREFGDTFAIIVTSLLFCTISTEFLLGIKWFFLSLPLCYFALKSNNVIVAIISRLICSISLQVVRILFTTLTTNIAYLIVVCIAVCALLFSIFSYFELDLKINDRDTHLTNFEKVYISISSFTFIALIILAIFKAQGVLQFIG